MQDIRSTFLMGVDDGSEVHRSGVDSPLEGLP